MKDFAAKNAIMSGVQGFVQYLLRADLGVTPYFRGQAATMKAQASRKRSTPTDPSEPFTLHMTSLHG
jgi:hypothetical protein